MSSSILDRVGSGIAVPNSGIAVGPTGGSMTSTRRDECIVLMRLTQASTLEYTIARSDGGPEPSTFHGEWVGGSGETATDAAGSAKDCRPVVTGDLMAGLRGTACSTT
jgi:hypothetical protein